MSAPPNENDLALLQFPCDFPIKIMGPREGDLRSLALELVGRHAADLDQSRVRVQDSRTGRYQSVTVVVPAQSREQLDAIYRELTGHPQIKLVL